MKRTLLSFAVLAALANSVSAGDVGPFTTKNDDSCDVMLAPAATLLLPYFEVDITNPTGMTTLFTVVNVTALPQIAHVTMWTDWAFPVVDFNIFLTGYDAQSINLYDILARGRIAEPGTTSDTDVGRRSSANEGNPLLDISDCDRLARVIPTGLLKDMQNALTLGRSSRCEGMSVGGTHAYAVGYVTIDVVASCSVSFPTDSDYATRVLLYDNVLSGDYEQVNSSQNFAQGGSMVHIRAFPEGGAPGAKPTNLTRTFYSNYQNGGTADRRQPLPATFAARWISGGPTAYETSFKIWREGITHSGDVCAVSSNANLPVREVVRFDEDENPTTFTPDGCNQLCPPNTERSLPAASRIDAAESSVFPPNPDASVAGWIYLNLDNKAVHSPVDRPSQNWVMSSMAAEGRYSTDIEAAMLGNGCSAVVEVTNEGGGIPAIGPAPNSVKTFATGSPATLNNDDSCDIMVAPAATLLLPYFEVDVTSPFGEMTLFTVTNVTPLPQIAHVTLWTDRSYPVLSFDVFLPGYDVQAINLYDVIARGVIAPPGTTSQGEVGRRSAPNDGNPLLNISQCGTLLTNLPPAAISDLQNALTLGRASGCLTAGGQHVNAIGHVTIDVVDRCGLGLPTDPNYFTQEILFDNVLIGDYQQVHSAQDFARGNPMVHIRAIPEGGRAADGTTNFARTFYSAYQGSGTTDRRQPLPSTFVARWISGGPTEFETSFKIWREAITGTAGCNVAGNSRIDIVEFVRFDEMENPTVISKIVGPPGPYPTRWLPTTIQLDARDTDLPPVYDDATVAGWMYVNLDSTEAVQGAASQGWVVVSMGAEKRYSVDVDALALGNGCSAAVRETDDEGRTPAIGPGL